MGYCIGVDLGGTNMAAGVLDETYAIKKAASVATRSGGMPEQIAEDMAVLIEKLMSDIGISKEKVEQIGIGIPGSVTKDGIVEDANNIGFFRVPFGRMMQQRMGIPVHLINDAAAAAMGEYRVGAGKGSSTFQMLTIGTGIGGAFIVNGNLISGCNGAAGEIGHMVIRQNGVLCTCGRKGCLEAYASAEALKRRMQYVVSREMGQPQKAKRAEALWNLSGKTADGLNGKVLFEAAEQKDALAMELLSEYIETLAEGIANLINILQPDVFCIGGGMSAQKEKLLEPLRRSVSEKIYSRHSEIQTKLAVAELGNNAGIIGAVF